MNVLITGSFDLLHSGHIYFMKRASKYGKLYVGIGSDKSIEQLKNRPTINKQDERLFMVKSIRYIEDAWINSGMGNFDFFDDIKKLKRKHIDILIVNKDQDFPEKIMFCKDNDIRYIVFKKKQSPKLPLRSSTQQRKYINLRKW
jgi:cytidyltransferase-like protein